MELVYASAAGSSELSIFVDAHNEAEVLFQVPMPSHWNGQYDGPCEGEGIISMSLVVILNARSDIELILYHAFRDRNLL